MRIRLPRRRLSRLLVKLGEWLLPGLYRLYAGCVWRTSRIEDRGLFRLHGVLARQPGAVALVWHEEVLGVAYAYPHLGYRPHTLASRSNAGALVTRVLERCGYGVFRGGTSRGRSRRHAAVWRDMIQHLRSHRGVLYGLAVDGSHGPAFRLKRGALVLARECGVPVVLVRTWYQRSLRLPGWDRSALPLPFNTIRHTLRGPFPVPRDARDPAGLERFRQRLEAEMRELAVESYEAFGQVPPASLRAASTAADDPTARAVISIHAGTR